MTTRVVVSALVLAACPAIGGCGRGNATGPAPHASPGQTDGALETSSRVKWKLVGVGLDGASLVVVPDRPRALCESFVGTYRPREGVSVSVTRGPSCDKDGMDPAIAIAPQPLTVPFPISGDVTELPKWQGPGYAGVADARRTLKRVPGVVGLKVDVACKLLREGGAREVTFRGSRREPVSGQKPSAWKPQTAGHYPEAELTTGYATGAGAQQRC